MSRTNIEHTGFNQAVKELKSVVDTHSTESFTCLNDDILSRMERLRALARLKSYHFKSTNQRQCSFNF